MNKSPMSNSSIKAEKKRLFKIMMKESEIRNAEYEIQSKKIIEELKNNPVIGDQYFYNDVY